jgi:hypothetical protein
MSGATLLCSPRMRPDRRKSMTDQGLCQVLGRG